MSGKKVVCLGGVAADVTCVSRKKLNMGGKNPDATAVLDAGGVTRNSGEVLARMGVDVSMVSAVGDDTFSDVIVSLCDACGMNTDCIERMPGQKATISMQMIDFDGELAVMAADINTEGELSIEHIKACDEVISSADALLVCATLSPKVLDYIFNTYSHLPIFMDVCAKQYADKIRPYLPKLHTLKANEEEAEALCGIALDTEHAFWNACKKLREMGAKNNVITLGGRGAIFTNELEQNLFPAKPVEHVVNAAGAGDSFFAGLVYGYLNNLPTEVAMKIGAACSRLTIQSEHTISPEITLDSVLKEAGLTRDDLN